MNVVMQFESSGASLRRSVTGRDIHGLCRRAQRRGRYGCVRCRVTFAAHSWRNRTLARIDARSGRIPEFY